MIVSEHRDVDMTQNNRDAIISHLSFKISKDLLVLLNYSCKVCYLNCNIMKGVIIMI